MKNNNVSKVAYTKYSDLILPPEFKGSEKIKFKQMIGKEFLFGHFIELKNLKSKYGKGKRISGLMVCLENLKTGKKYRTTILSQVICEQFLKQKENLPFLATVEKRGKYWTLK